MKSVRMDSLLEIPEDGVAFQKEWSVRGRQGWRALLLEAALLFGNIGPGLFMVSYVIGLEAGYLVSFFIVALGYAVPHVLFLGRVERFYLSLLRPGSSWISRGSIFANLFLLFSFLSILHLMPFVSMTFIKGNADLYRMVALAGCISAFLLALYPGFLFSVLRSIPFWHSIFIVPLFLIQSFGGGIALVLITADITGIIVPEAVLYRADLMILALVLLMVALHYYVKSKSGEAAAVSARYLVRGKYRWIFLVGGILCGILAPTLLLVMALTGVEADLTVTAASLLQLAGILFLKYSILNAGAYNRLIGDR